MSPVNQPTQRARRSGITLLEILISIGVLSVGLLGVIILIPAATQQANSGVQKDAAAALGRRAFREMNVRWGGEDAPESSLRNGVLNPVDATEGVTDLFYCIDPLGLVLKYPGERTGLKVDPLGSGTGATGVLSANRVALANVGQSITVFDQPALINEVFRSNDDLDFGDYAARENPAPNPPQQVALTDSTGIGAKRYASGALSWFATVHARNSGFNTVSVAVVNNRTGDEFVSEVTPASFPILGGVGEIEVPILISETPTPAEEAWSNVKSGHWILLVHDTGAADTGAGEWYRIQSIAPVDNDSDGIDDHRALSVVGPDWLVPNNTKAILIPQVVAVYSRSQSR